MVPEVVALPAKLREDPLKAEGMISVELFRELGLDYSIQHAYVVLGSASYIAEKRYLTGYQAPTVEPDPRWVSTQRK